MSKVSIQGDVSGTGDFTIKAPNSNTDRTLTLPDEAGTVLTNGSNITQNSGPAFAAYYSSGSSTSISSGTFTKIPFHAEEFDTDGCFDNATNYRFTPTVAGYYQLNASVSPGGVNADFFLSTIYKNGTRHKDGCNFPTTSAAGPTSNVSAVVYANGSTDYFEVYVIIATATTINNVSFVNANYFNGCLVRTA